MKIEIEMTEFVAAVAEAVAQKLRPMLKGTTAPSVEGDGLLDVGELSTFLGASTDWIYQRTAKNEIPFVKVGRLLKFRRSEIDRWLSAHSVPAVAPLSAPLPRRRARDSQSDEGAKTHRKTG